MKCLPYIPFHDLSNNEFIYELSTEKLEFWSYCNSVFKPFEHIYDDDNTNPDGIIDGYVRYNICKCPYYELDDYENLINNSELSNITYLFINIRNISRNLDELLSEFSFVTAETGFSLFRGN